MVTLGALGGLEPLFGNADKKKGHDGKGASVCLGDSKTSRAPW
jgi:hypothetical protein